MEKPPPPTARNWRSYAAEQIAYKRELREA